MSVPFAFKNYVIYSSAQFTKSMQDLRGGQELPHTTGGATRTGKSWKEAGRSMKTSQLSPEPAELLEPILWCLGELSITPVFEREKMKKRFTLLPSVK